MHGHIAVGEGGVGRSDEEWHFFRCLEGGFAVALLAPEQSLVIEGSLGNGGCSEVRLCHRLCVVLRLQTRENVWLHIVCLGEFHVDRVGRVGDGETTEFEGVVAFSTTNGNVCLARIALTTVGVVGVDAIDGKSLVVGEGVGTEGNISPVLQTLHTNDGPSLFAFKLALHKGGVGLLAVEVVPLELNALAGLVEVDGEVGWRLVVPSHGVFVGIAVGGVRLQIGEPFACLGERTVEHDVTTILHPVVNGMAFQFVVGFEGSDDV